MHIIQNEFVTGEVRLTLEYRTNSGSRRLMLRFTGDDIGAQSEDTERAHGAALKLLTEFINAAHGDIEAKRIIWRGI